MPTVITQELIDQILKMHKSGMTGVSIAKQLGIGKTTVNKYIRIYSDDYKVVNTDKFTNDFVDRMTQEYKEGKTVNELATKYHVSASSLATYIYRNVKGVESQGKKVTSKKEKDNTFPHSEIDTRTNGTYLQRLSTRTIRYG